jgi:hypothetical protein
MSNDISGKTVAVLALTLIVVLSPTVGPVSFAGTADAAPGDILYRANAGGSLTADGTTWDPLTDYLVAGGGQTSNHGQPSSIDDSVPPGTPTEIWNMERWDPGDGDEMQYEFSVPSGQQVEVRLYFYDGYSGTSDPGDRVFDVSVEGQTVEDFDPIAAYGDQKGGMESFTVTSDGTVDVDFTHVVENPQINAIEIVESGPQSGVLGGPDAVGFGTVVTGNSATETVTLANAGESGDAAITVSGVSVTGADANEFSTDFSDSTTLAPGESLNVGVTFTPSDAQAKSATLDVTHDAPNTTSPLTVDLTGEGASDVPVGFGSSELQGFNAGALTALEFGPDGRLYVAQQSGSIYALEIERNGANSYSVVNQETIDAINDIPNHDDDGSLNTGQSNRQVTGLTVGGTASQPVVYVSSSDPRIGGGGSGAELDLDTNSGSISRLTFDWNTDGSLASVDHDVMVLGLPRSEENHAPNGLDLSDDGETLYLAQGGNTNKGAPSNNFAYTPEYALSSAALTINLTQIEANHVEKNFQDYSPPTGSGTYPDLTFYYAIPTIQTDDATDGDDLPFGGQDGVNQAKVVENGPVQVFSSGYRNPYDLVLSEDDQLYVIDNGPNGNWGGQPVDEGASGICTNEPNEAGSYSTGDQLHLATEGSYGGHAVPIRANPTGADIYDENGNLVLDINESNSPVPASLVNPIECDYQDPTEDNSIGSTFGWTGGIEEYTASNFGGAMQGDLLVVEGGSNVERVELNAAGDGVTNQEDSFLTPGTALGIEATGDEGPFPGTVWTARGDLTVYEPNDYDGSTGTQCTGADDPSLDEDGDGYDNADEIDAGTDPCSGGSAPADFDGDGTSNLNDPDDDNDGVPDTSDPFAVDPDNGTTTTLPVTDDLTETMLFGENSQAWTGLMTNGQDDYQDLYAEDPGTVGGAAGAMLIEGISAGDATQNNQENAFQFGVNTPNEPFVISTTVNGFPESPSGYQGIGLFIGTGDQDNYTKLVVAANNGNGGVQLFQEVGGNNNGISMTADGNVTGPDTNTNLYLTVDPTTDPNPSNGVDEVGVSAEYSIGDGPRQAAGSGAMPASWLDSSDGTAPAVGIISTSYQADSTFDGTWKKFYVQTVAAVDNQPPTADAGADQTVDEGTTVQLNASGSTDPDADMLGYSWTQTAGPTVQLDIQDTATPTFTAPQVDSETTVTFDVTVSDGQASDTDTVNVSVQDTDEEPSTGSDAAFAVNAGGSDYTATDGTTYVADQNFTGGQTFTSGSAGTPSQPEIANTDDDELYWTERYGTEFGYAVPVENGTYEVTLAFAELYQGVANNGGEGDRIFDASVEGQTVLDDYDITAEADAPQTAVTETFTVDVTDGELNVGFNATGDDAVDNAKVSAISVTAVDDTTNTPPTVDAIDDQTVIEGESITIPVTASDDDGDSVSLSVDGPDFVTLSNGEVTVAPQSGDAANSPYTVDVVADDGTDTTTETFTVTVEEPAPTVGSALVEVLPDSGNVDASTYGGGSYQVTNTGEKNISSVSFDLSTAALPDMVFDPAGTAGDPTGEGLNIASDGGTGITTAGGGSDEAFSQPHNGVDGADGYDVMTVNFSDFQPGETATFWADNDPTSIKGATVNSQEAGPVSGLELARATVTVTYEDGTTQTTQLMGDGSNGGSTAVVTDDEAPAPTIGAQGVSLDGSVLDGDHSGATVSATDQTITVTGQPGETVTLVRVEGELSLSNVPDADGDGEPGYDIEALEANNAVAVEYYTVTLDGNGEATMPVTLTSSADDSDEAGFNYFVAAHGQASGDMGLASNVVVLQYEEAPANTVPTLDAITDQGVSQDESTSVDVNASDADVGDSLTLSADGPAWVSLADNGDGTGTLTLAPDGTVPVGTYTVEVNVSDGQANETEEFAVYVDEPDQDGEVVVAVNAGGSEYTAGDGTVYEADSTNQYFTGGSTYGTGQSINATDDDTLYQTERYGGSGGGNFGYDVPVENDTYEVTLQFAEIFQGVAGSDSPGGADGTNENDRLFSVSIEGQTVVTEYDIYSEVGPLTATDKTYTVEVTDGTLNIDFSASADNGKISAIRVESLDSNQAPTVGTVVDQTVTEGESVTVPVTASDADGDALTLSLNQSAPDFVTLTDESDGDGTLTIAPTSGDAGIYTVEVIADDGTATGTATFTLTVEEPEPVGPYGVTTGDATNVQIDTSTLTNASGTLNGSLSLGEKTEATTYVKIWPQGQPDDAFWYTGDTVTQSGEFSFDVVLSPSTTYDWQVLAQSGDDEWKAGAVETFTTPTGQFFGVDTADATDVGVESATLNGEIVNLGDNIDAQVYFTYWKQGQKESTLTWYTGPVQNSPGTFNATVGLEPDTTYEYRAFGQSDESEWKAGPVKSLTTQVGEPYGVTTDDATDVTTDGATLNGELTGLGDHESATVYFQYWVQGQKSSTLTWYTGSAQSGPGTFSADVTLQNDTTYVVQAYAQSDDGTWTAGSEVTVTTPASSGTTQQELTVDTAAPLGSSWPAWGSAVVPTSGGMLP